MKAKTRLGNWLEEIAFEEDKKALQKRLQESGGLLSQKILAKVQQHTAAAELGCHGEHLVYGSPFMLRNVSTKGVIAIDMDDRQLGPLGWKINPSTSQEAAPQLRNCWVVLPPPSNKTVSIGDVVCYGHKVVIASVPELAEPSVFLSSEMKTPQSCSKLSKNQETYFSPNGGMSALWTFEYANSEYREDVIDQPVKVTTPICLKHVATNMSLASTTFKFTNDFGYENEVCCGRFQGYASKGGKAPETDENLWEIVVKS